MSTFGRERLAEIFNDTSDLCRNHSLLKQMVDSANKEQMVILEGDEVTGSERKYEKPAKIVVSQKRTLEASRAYSAKEVCVHNFASAVNPGGGVERGASAQEECICRSSTLFFNLTDPKVMKSFYYPHRKTRRPLGSDDCIYTPNVMVFKTDAAYPELLSEEEWYSVNVITCAAPNLRAYQGRISQKELKELHIKRMRRILDIAKAKGNTVVILGAFGCGVFQNQPEVVAEAYASIIEEYRYDFEVIEFAVYCTPKDTRNYDVFQRRLKIFQKQL